MSVLLAMQALRLPSFVASVTVVNATEHDFRVDVGSPGHAGWLDLGSVLARSTRTKRRSLTRPRRGVSGSQSRAAMPSGFSSPGTSSSASTGASRCWPGCSRSARLFSSSDPPAPTPARREPQPHPRRWRQRRGRGQTEPGRLPAVGAPVRPRADWTTAAKGVGIDLKSHEPEFANNVGNAAGPDVQALPIWREVKARRRPGLGPMTGLCPMHPSFR